MSDSRELGVVLHKTAVLAITTHGRVLTSNNDAEKNTELVKYLEGIQRSLDPGSIRTISLKIFNNLKFIGIVNEDQYPINHTQTNVLLLDVISELKQRPLTFTTPVKLIKYSVVPAGICNITSDNIITKNISAIIEENKETLWDTIDDGVIEEKLSGIAENFKLQFSKVVKSVKKDDVEKLHPETLNFFHKGDSGNTFRKFEAHKSAVDKYYMADKEESTELYSDKILLLNNPVGGQPLDLYKVLVTDRKMDGIKLSQVVTTLSKFGFERIVVIDFTCNTTNLEQSGREARAFNGVVTKKLGGKRNKTNKSRKSRKSTKTKKSRKSRRKR